MTAQPKTKFSSLIGILASAVLIAAAFVLVPRLSISNLALAESSQQFINGFGFYAPIFSFLELTTEQWLQLSKYINPIFLWLAFALPFSRMTKTGKWFEMAVLALIFLGSHQLLYFSQWSIAYSTSILGLVWVVEGNAVKKPGLSIITLTLGLFLSFSSTFWIWPILIWLTLFSAVSKPSKLKHVGISLTIASVAAFVLMPNYFDLLQEYLKQAENQFIFKDSTATLAKNLTGFYGPEKLITNANPIFLILLALALLSKARIQFVGVVICLVIVLISSGLFPLFSGHDGFALSVVLMPLGLLLLKSQSEHKKIQYAILGAALLLGVFNGHLNQGFSGYYQSGLLSLQNSFDKMTTEESDYLNTSGFQFKEKYPSVLANFDTKGHGSSMAYERQSRKQLSLVISRFGRQKYLINSAAFPPTGVIERRKNSENLTTVVLSAPIKAVAKAYELIKNKQYGAAIVRFRELSDSLPNNPEVWYGFSKSQFLFSEWDDALKTCNSGLSLAPTQTELLCLKAEIFLKRNQKASAFQLLKMSRLADSSYARPYWLKAMSLIEKDSLRAANLWLKRALPKAHSGMKMRIEKTQELIALKGEQPYTDNEIEKYFIQKINKAANQKQVQLNKLESIEDELRAVIELDSSNAILRSHLGVLYMMMQDYARAAQAFEKGVALNPNYPQMRDYMVIARINWGTQEFEQDSLRAALFNFSYALDYDTKNQSALYNMAATHTELAKRSLENNDVEDAYNHLKAALKFNQTYSDAYLTMGYLQLQKNEADSAEIAFNQAFLTDKKNADAIEELIKIYQEQGETYKVKVYKDRLNNALKK